MRARVSLGKKDWLSVLNQAYRGFSIIDDVSKNRPGLIDAQLPIGIIGYYASVSNVFLRWLVKLYGLDTSKKEGIYKIEDAATNSDWAWIEASGILSFIYLWIENKPEDAIPITKKLSEAGKIFKKIASSTLKEIESDKELNLLINTYNNTKVRANERITNTSAHVKGMIDWVNARYDKQADKLSSAKGKAGVEAKRERVLKFFSKSNQKKLKLVFDLQNFIVDSKLIIINKLNSLNKIGTFVKTKSGFKVTNPEGFVAIDRMEGGAVKLVDRLEFSTNNFSKDIIKGWDNPN